MCTYIKCVTTDFKITWHYYYYLISHEFFKTNSQSNKLKVTKAKPKEIYSVQQEQKPDRTPHTDRSQSIRDNREEHLVGLIEIIRA